MSIKSEFSDFVGFIGRRGWSEDDFKKLMRVVYECYSVDQVVSPEELEEFTKKLETHHLDIKDIKALDFQHSLYSLSIDIPKKKLLYSSIADAIFADEDYDSIESNFVDSIIQKFELDGAYLRKTIQEIRDQHIDRAIRKWYHDEVK